MDKIKELVGKCAAGVHIIINEHKDYYETVEQHLSDDADDMDKDVLKKMIELDMCIVIQFYPNTPVGFYRVLHYDLDMALNECLDILK